MHIGLYVKYQLSLSNLNKTWILSHFQKILEYQIPWKSVHWESSYSTQMIEQTDTYDEANSRFLQFCEHTYKQMACILQSVYKFNLHSHKKHP
jgi:hypothetical protein